ncbi:MAG: GNAT family N-acetyltransferase [Alphaproteobacteria bacterium]|nr:GNAT family N-acetyltransferase [Alphaproteobacteria bacterium]
MAFLRPATATEPSVAVRARRVYLRPLVLDDYTEWSDLRAGSRDHLEPWEPAWRKDELWKSSFRKRIRHYQREAREDLGYAFGIFEADSGGLIGGLTLGNVRRGVMQCANLGYWLGRSWAGQGLMSESVRAIIPHAFGELRLHRLEAASMPSNTASIRVLESTGFVREGVARRYLKISGVWQDHLRFGLVTEDLDQRAGKHD